MIHCPCRIITSTKRLVYHYQFALLNLLHRFFSVENRSNSKSRFLLMIKTNWTITFNYLKTLPIHSSLWITTLSCNFNFVLAKIQIRSQQKEKKCYQSLAVDFFTKVIYITLLLFFFPLLLPTVKNTTDLRSAPSGLLLQLKIPHSPWTCSAHFCIGYLLLCLPVRRFYSTSLF